MESWQLVKDIKRLKQHRKINQQQYRTLLGQIKSGDGWTVDVIAHILKNIEQ